MNWIVNDARPQADGDAWLAGSRASLHKKATAPTIWTDVFLQVIYQSAGGNLYIIIDPWYIEIEKTQGRITLSRYINGNLLEAWDFEEQPDGWDTVEIAAALSTITITVNGTICTYESALPTPMALAELQFPPGSQFLEPEISVIKCVAENEISTADSQVQKALEFTVDFYDDLQVTVFNQGMLDEMFRIMARLGASQAYWIHHCGKGTGLWETGPGRENIARTFESVGDDYLPAAVNAAHKVGLPLIGIFKPFDTAILHYTIPVSDNHAAALGGRLYQGFTFPTAHPELCQQRRSIPATPGRPTQITVCSRYELTHGCAEEIALYVSHDNASYDLYSGPLKTEVNGCQITLSELEIEEAFIVLSFSPGLAARIENTLPLLVQVRDADGDILEFTYGIASRLRRTSDYHLAGNSQHLDFREHGLNFDCNGHGVPSAVWNSRKSLLELYSPANSHGALGLALGSNAFIPGVLSEAEPQAHAWWLSIIEEMLDAGVDGIEIRVMNHSNIIDWNQYGFNASLVEEYRRRWGIDITRQDFSREKFRELRGEFFTDFLRSASRLTRERGKKFRMHIEDLHQGPASEPCPMEIVMPWRQWIEENLCDGITLKALNTRSHDTAFGREVIAACHARNIPVSYTPFVHSVFASDQHRQLLDSFFAGPCDAFNIYEFATLFKFTPEGEAKIMDRSIIDWLSSHQWRQRSLANSPS